MAEYIEREALRDDIRESYLKLQEIYETLRYERERDICNGELGTFCEVLMRIKDFPAADVAPVVRGRWKYWDGWKGNHDQRIDDATCSKCGYKFPFVFRPTQEKKHTPDNLPNYCPICGAHMRGE